MIKIRFVITAVLLMFTSSSIADVSSEEQLERCAMKFEPFLHTEANSIVIASLRLNSHITLYIDCHQFALDVFAAAAAQGYSVREALDAAHAALVMCQLFGSDK